LSLVVSVCRATNWDSISSTAAWAFIRSEDGTTGSVGAYTWSIAAAILTTCLGIPLALALPRHKKKPPAAGSKAVIKPVPVAG